MTENELKIAPCPECGSPPEICRSCGGDFEWVSCEKCDIDDETVTEWRDWIVQQDEDLTRENELKVAILKVHLAEERLQAQLMAQLDTPAILAARQRLESAERAVYDSLPGKDRGAAIGELAEAERALINTVLGRDTRPVYGR